MPEARTGEIELISRSLRRESHLMLREPEFLASRLRNAIFLASGEEDPARAALEGAQAALARRSWLRLVNRPAVPGGARTALVRTLQPGGPVRALAWSPDGRILATAGEGPIVLWDAAGGQQTASLASGGRPEASVAALAWSPDGSLLAWCGEGVPTTVSSPRPGSAETLAADLPAHAVAWSPDGQSLAIGVDLGETGGGVRVWDRRAAHLGALLQGPSGQVHGLAWSPDGGLLAAASAANAMAIWEATDWHLRFQTDTTGPVLGVAWAADGRRIAFVGLADLAVTLVDLEALQATRQRPLLSSPSAVAWSPDGSVLAAGCSDGSVCIGADGVPRRVQAQSAWIHAVAFSPDARLLAAASSDGTTSLFDVDKLLRQSDRDDETGHTINVNAVAWSPDGSVLASAGMDSTLRLWSIDGEPRGVLGHDGPVTAAAWQHRDAVLASGQLDIVLDETGAGVSDVRRTGAIRLWDPRTGQATGTHAGIGEMIRALAWSPDDSRLAAAVADGSLWLLVPGTEALREVISGNGREARCVCWSPDGRRVAIGGDDGIVRICHDDGGPAVELPCEPGAVTALAWAPNGETLAAGTPEGISLAVNPPDGPRRTLGPHFGAVQALAWSPDSGLLAAGDDSGATRVWDVTEGRCVAAEWALSPIGAIRFGLDGKLSVGDTGAASMHRPLAYELELLGAETQGGFATTDGGTTLDEALGARPDVTSLVEAAGRSFQRGDLPGAVATLEKAIELDPACGAAHYNLSEAYLQMGELERGLEHATEAIACDPDDADAYNNRGSALAQLGRLEEAVDDLERALELNPELAMAHYNLAGAHYLSGRVQEAAEQWRRFLELSPDQDRAEEVRGILRDLQPDP